MTAFPQLDGLVPRTQAFAPDHTRARFSAALSAMYGDEVPACGALMDLVGETTRRKHFETSPSQRASETALCTQVLDQFAPYAAVQAESLKACRATATA